MVSERPHLCSKGTSGIVLILVLVEDGLRVKKYQARLEKELSVLILVLVEDGLREMR